MSKTRNHISLPPPPPLPSSIVLLNTSPNSRFLQSQECFDRRGMSQHNTIQAGTGNDVKQIEGNASLFEPATVTVVCFPLTRAYIIPSAHCALSYYRVYSAWPRHKRFVFESAVLHTRLKGHCITGSCMHAFILICVPLYQDIYTLSY